MNISSIYAGKPDASDEIRERGYEEFANNYIEPSGVNIERLASTEYGTPFFIDLIDGNLLISPRKCL